MIPSLSRRAWLGGGVAALVLPWLEARRSIAHADPGTAPTRLVCFYVPNGMPMDAWHVAPELPDAMLSPLLAVREHVSLVTGLQNAPADVEGAGHHATGTAGFLTAARAVRSDHAPVVGVSLDQRYAQQHEGATPWSSLQLGLEGGGGAGNCDNGFACAYSRNISWADASTPMPKLTDPRVVFDLLFAGADASPAERAERRALRHSVLDGVLGQTAALRRGLGSDDRARLDGWHDSVRALERRIDAPPPRCELGMFDPAAAVDVQGQVRAMNELMVLALRCDSTRVISFMLGNSASDRPCSFLGIADTHHSLSHHAGDPEKLAALAVIGRWELECFVDLLARMAAVDEGDGSLLDHAAVLLGSELSDPNAHRHDDLPLLLAGRAGGQLSPGGTLAYPGRALGDLHLSLLQRLGVAIDRFGDDGRTPLAQL